MTVTWNPSDKSTGVTLTNSDLTATGNVSDATFKGVRATLSRSTGRYYFEGVIQNPSIINGGFGLMTAAASLAQRVGFDAVGWGELQSSGTDIYKNHSNSLTSMASSTGASGLVYRVAVDLDAGKLWFGIDGKWYGSTYNSVGDPDGGTNPTFTSVTGTLFPAVAFYYNGQAAVARFAISSFEFTIPSGFTAWDDVTDTGDRTCRLLGQAATMSSGVLTSNSLNFKLQGSSVTVSRTGPTSNSLNYVLSGRSMTVGRGTIKPGISPVGQQLTVQGGLLGVSNTNGMTGQSALVIANGIGYQAPFDALFPLGGPTLIAQQGVVSTGAGASVGNATTGLLSVPKVASAFLFDVSSDPYRMEVGITAQYVNAETYYTYSFISFEGKLRGVADIGYDDTYGSGFPSNWTADYRARIGYALDQQEQLLGTEWSSTLTESSDYRHLGVDGALTTYALIQKTDIPINGSLPYSQYTPFTEPYYLTPAITPTVPTRFRYNVGAGALTPGGYYSIGLDGSFHWVFNRNHVNQPDELRYNFVYQNSVRDAAGAPNTAFSMQYPFEDGGDTLLGLYAHEVSRVYAFYSNTTDLNGNGPAYELYPPAAWGGVLAGNEAKMKGGVLQVFTSTSNVTYQLFGREISVLTRAQMLRASGVAYRVWDGTNWSSKQVFRETTYRTLNSLATGAPEIFIRSGYGDIVYGVSSNALLVMNARTGALISLEYNAPTTVGTPTDNSKRPLADVAVLSNGTSITQFVVNGKVVRLSWTSSTYLTPTLTYKDAFAASLSYPESTAKITDVLEIRGDTVQHILLEPNSRNPTGDNATELAVYYRANDATGTGSSWSSLTQLFVWGDGVNKVFGPINSHGGGTTHNFWWGGYGGGLPSYLQWFSRTTSATFSPPVTRNTGRAWIDWWGGFSLPIFASVGWVTVSIVNELAVALTGQAATAQCGALTTTIDKALATQAAATQQGAVGVLLNTIQLTGQQTSVQRGDLIPVQGASLIGQQVAVQSSTPGILFQLSLGGVPLVVSEGQLTPIVTYAWVGQQIAVQRGGVEVTNAPNLIGQSLSALSNVLVPTAFYRLLDGGVQVSAGAVAPLTSLRLVDSQLLVSRGVVGFAFDVRLLGGAAAVTESSLGFLYDCNLFPIGLQALAELGVYPTTTNVPAIRADRHLWVQLETETLFAVELPGDLHVDIEPGQ